MKAVILSGLGSINNLKHYDVAIPQPKQNEALIKVEYCGINHLDLLIILGKRPGPKSFPHLLGSEIVGTISSLDRSSHMFKIGNPVAVYPWTFCGKCQPCKEGHENICDYGGTIGRTQWGGYAQYVVAPIKNLIKIPQNLALNSICALTLSGITAYHLIGRAKITSNSTVLITGTTGGVGTIAIQLLKNKKCRIICATSHVEKISKLKSLGVNSFVSTNNLISEVKKLAPAGVDYIIDIMGGAIWSQALETLAKNGTIVFCSTTLDEPGQVNLASAFSKQINILGSYGGTIMDLRKVIELYQKGILKPEIDSTYSLEKAKLALKKMESQLLFGKVLLKP